MASYASWMIYQEPLWFQHQFNATAKTENWAGLCVVVVLRQSALKYWNVQKYILSAGGPGGNPASKPLSSAALHYITIDGLSY